MRKATNRRDIEAAVAASTRLPSTVSGYERIRVVGKGSFGSAILYRRKADDSLVVIKEINMHELSTAERQLALNEVSLLSSMDHPHIISYYDSFEEDGILMIEMEYADGGTLAQFLARRTDYVPEAEILYMFEQMLTAVAYLHDNNVLHRDLKTANIFLTKDNHIKIGDFGISKIMGTETRFAGAQTVVGTPYYISPEMCEGRSYNSKSDIWALGCILYEMACLQKTFEGSNLPALVGKIVKGNYEQIRGPYSNDLKLLVREMLKVEPEFRPTATKVLEMVQRSRGKKGDRFRGVPRSQSPRNCHSALYEFDIAKVTLNQSNTPKNIRVKQLAVGQEHILMLTIDNVVYAWGDNKFGQLGLGDRRARLQPVRIEILDGKDITRIACGATFSVFCADRGIVMVCGNRKFTGNGKTKEDYLKPKVIDSLLRDDIVDLSVGTEHAAAVCGDGQVFVWGNGQSGQLGTGKQEHVQTARKVEIPAHLVVINVKCGPDSTALITSCGTLILMGSNKFNKLNLNTRIGFFAHVKNTQSDIENILIPTCMKAFNSRVVDVSLGSFHSGVLLESGHVHLFGRNEFGELGLGHRQPMDFWVANRPVKALVTKACVQLFCGDGFTVVATADNELYFWGTKGIMRKINDAVTIEDLEICERVETCSQQQKRITDSATKDRNRASATTKKHWPFQKGMENLEEEEEDLCTIPSLVLRLDSTRDSAGSKPFIKLAQLEGKAKRVFVVINTSPSTPKGTNSAIGRNTMMSLATNWGRRRRSAPELTETSVPTWVQNELNDAEYLSYSQFIPGPKPPIPISSENLQTEKQLHSEIEELKRQVQKQSTTFKGHETQMALLQKKLAELQALHSRAPNEAPPPYPQSAKDQRKRIIRNSFTPETQTKVCNIL